ncbi:acetyltransferase, partial [Vibrio metschnikovii]|nr:acetyltransferase [Vibrio metschnikovii]
MRYSPLNAALCFLSRFGAIIGQTFIDSRCDMNRKVEAYG